MSIFSSKALKCLFLAKALSGHMAFVLLVQGTWEYKEFPEHIPTSFLCLPLVRASWIVPLLEDWVHTPRAGLHMDSLPLLCQDSILKTN